MHAPQSQLRSEAQLFRAQWCGDVDLASQAVFTGHLNAPPTHETSAQPFGVWFCPAPQAYPSGQANPSVAQLAKAQP
jgi:hypothetical protein